MSSPAPALRNTNPDQLDLMVRVASPMGWLVLAVFLCAVFGGLAWAVFATAPIKVAGTGVLQGSGGVILVSAPGSAPLSALKVKVGDSVRAGEIVATLSDPVLDARVETIEARIARLGEEQARLAAFHAREKEVRARADAQRRDGLERTIQQAREREAALGQVLANQRDLLGRGLATRERVLITENDREQARRDATEAANALNTLVVEADERGIRAERELLEVDTKLNQGRQELAEVMAERSARTEVRAPAAGRVIELSAAPGDRVAAGGALMRLVPDGRNVPGAGLVGILYVPTADGKKVRPGMAVQVIPSTVRIEREGFIQGEVVRVSETPATREAVQQTLKNDAFVTSLMANGPPFAVEVALKRDPATASGFAWSSDLGGTRPVESGTVIKGNVVVERVRIMTLVFPAFDTLLHALGVAP
ncbi:NHLP bacteriocin system secretion protein [Azorhizobium doebereinerae]|uniref:NHLP bacteriocin system secretion protein n=1 Tax=Azorhizobium doebereinerae TaxID=281091 RepID=UPI00040FCB37|nr:NHLP bacteriocin system secretion protein [Azorhizobium doebereinerae]